MTGAHLILTDDGEVAEVDDSGSSMLADLEFPEGPLPEWLYSEIRDAKRTAERFVLHDADRRERFEKFCRALPEAIDVACEHAGIARDDELVLNALELEVLFRRPPGGGA